MLDFEVSSEGENKDWDEVLPRGEFELVSLNTMIPRKVSQDLAIATGWLQLANPRLRYTKQATVQYLLERGLQSLFEDIEKADSEPSEEIASTELAPDSKVIDIIHTKRKEIDPRQYEQFANKHSNGYKFGR